MLILYWKNGKGEGEKKEKRTYSHKQSEGLGGVLMVYKVGLKWPVIATEISQKPNN